MGGDQTTQALGFWAVGSEGNGEAEEGVEQGRGGDTGCSEGPPE